MPRALNDKKTLEHAKKVLSTYKICDHCLGRIFAHVEKGKLNQNRGSTLRKHLKHHKKIKVKDCWLCNGLLDEIPHFVDLISDSLEDYEFDNFLIGSKVDEDVIGREQEIWKFAGSDYAESIKTELNREIGKILEGKLQKEVNFEKPTIMAVIDTAFDVVNLQITSLFIYGRYNKYVRDIPQTRWFCKICRGKGCRHCNYTGKLYENSVEELVAQPFIEQTCGTNKSFHGCGREDIDVRMLGNGRPFVLEIKNPKYRLLELSKIEDLINVQNKGVIEVNNLRFSDRNEIVRIKNAAFRKIYRIVFKSEKPVNSGKLKKAIQVLRSKAVGQQTPSRVAHRRANMVREKQIYNCNIEAIDGAMATLTLEAESGTYIKELVSGDDEKTKPNLSELIGTPCNVTALDVIEIKGE